MAQQNEANQEDVTPTSRRRAMRNAQVVPSRKRRPVATAAAKPARTGRSRPAQVLRSTVIMSMVGGLIVTVALPAYGAIRTFDKEVTIQQVAASDAQNFVVASDVASAGLNRDSYSATSADEIAQKKAEEAAAAAAAARARQASFASVNVDLTMSPGTGQVRWPLPGFTMGDGFRSRGGAHQGVDMLAPAMTPIYASAAGVVRLSQESYYGYGVAVIIDHVINGQKVSTLYGHMTNGSRQVQAGQTVEAGQVIGGVGSTGRSTANHVHFETTINGQRVDPIAWLQANAG